MLHTIATSFDSLVVVVSLPLELLSRRAATSTVSSFCTGAGGPKLAPAGNTLPEAIEAADCDVLVAAAAVAYARFNGTGVFGTGTSAVVGAGGARG